MAGQAVKCQWCKATIPSSVDKETLAKEVKVSDSTGKSKNLYYHPECYPEYLKDVEFRKKEREQKDELNETVKKIYNLQFNLPVRWWEYVSDFREGTNRHEKFWKKKYKKGVPFNVIREAFLLSVQDIEWARMNKKFSNLDQELRYGLMIMQGKVNDAYRKMKTREQQAKQSEAMEKLLLEDMKDNREVSFNKKQQENRDFSYLLGND